MRHAARFTDISHLKANHAYFRTHSLQHIGNK